MNIEHRTADIQITDIEIAGVDEPVWFTALVGETAELDRTGVSAAVLSLRLAATEDTNRRSQQMHNLLRRALRPTDRVGSPGPDAYSILLAPLDSITHMAAQVQTITDALERAGIEASAGFARRRAGESLLDTWARAEAEADRAAYRAMNSGGLLLGE